MRRGGASRWILFPANLQLYNYPTDMRGEIDVSSNLCGEINYLFTTHQRPLLASEFCMCSVLWLCSEALTESVRMLHSCAIVIDLENSSLPSSHLLIFTHPYTHLSSMPTAFNKFSACGKHWMINTHSPQADFSNIGNLTGNQRGGSLTTQPHL